ncbi:MAG: hypothetical protein BMS9Abin17_1163 [Acidimicrobiia bacterium]|nr:MAG: hypothetical protein BMS9Abin17_1163 [Acidimicrobiia bacterium]
MPTENETAKRRGLSVIHAAPLLVAFLLALRASELIRDNSFLWHIRAGSVQVASGKVLTTDPFSYTANGEGWRTQSWLVDLMYARLESVTGSLTWANWFVFVVGAGVLVLMGIAIYDRTRSPVVLTGSLIVAMWLFAPFAQARPVIVSYVLMASLVLILRWKSELLWLLVPLFWIWAGVHGSWVLGGGLVILELLRTRDTRLVRVGAVSLFATLATAHGIGTWTVLYEFSQAREALGLIEEWLPPDFGDIAQAPYLIVLIGLFFGFARGKLEARDLIVILPFLIFGMTSRRAVFPATIVLLPYAVSAVPVPKLHARATSGLAPVIAMVLLAGVALSPMVFRPLGLLDAERFPRASIVDSVEGRTPFHDSAVGGYLIYDSWPTNLVYIDDRAELYGFERFQDLRKALSGDYEDVFERNGIEVAIVKPDSPLHRRLVKDGWSAIAVTDEFISMEP